MSPHFSVIVAVPAALALIVADLVEEEVIEATLVLLLLQLQLLNEVLLDSVWDRPTATVELDGEMLMSMSVPKRSSPLAWKKTTTATTTITTAPAIARMILLRLLRLFISGSSPAMNRVRLD